MIDIHHHLIYAVDDGSPDLKTSLAMARQSADEGVTHIVCTPHASNEYPYEADLVEERLAELRDLLAGVVELSLGCDFHLTSENISDALANPFRYSIADKGYLLIEFSFMAIAPQLIDAVFQLQAKGYTPIITHPERYPAMQNRPQLLSELMLGNCLVQVTAGSLLGRFGRTAEAFSNELLERNWIHFLASDAHNATSRPPCLKAACDYVANRMGEETARRLCLTNPQAAVEGAPWPEQPEALGLSENVPLKFATKNSGGSAKSTKDATRKAAGGFWNRIFTR